MQVFSRARNLFPKVKWSTLNSRWRDMSEAFWLIKTNNRTMRCRRPRQSLSSPQKKIMIFRSSFMSTASTERMKEISWVMPFFCLLHFNLEIDDLEILQFCILKDSSLVDFKFIQVFQFFFSKGCSHVATALASSRCLSESRFTLLNKIYCQEKSYLGTCFSHGDVIVSECGADNKLSLVIFD